MIETIPDALDDERVDRVISMLLGVSRSVAANAVVSGLVALDGSTVTKASHRVATDQELSVDDSVLDTEVEITPDADVDVDIVHADEHVIVVAKRAGQVVHPGAGNANGTIAQGLLAQFPEIREVGEPLRPGIVHRLDKGTTGVLMVARTRRGL